MKQAKRDCYELAFRAVTRPGSERNRLVHGWIIRPPPRRKRPTQDKYIAQRLERQRAMVNWAKRAEKLMAKHGNTAAAICDTLPLRLLIGYRPDTWVEHAWVLLADGRVYDPVLDKQFDGNDYAVQYKAVVGRIYTSKQAAKAAAAGRGLWGGPHGPWWTDDEIVRQSKSGLR